LIVTRLDHDANVAPWLAVAKDCGLVVRWLDFDPSSGRLLVEALPQLLSARTRLVAVVGASNALGTIVDLDAVVHAVRAHSAALIYVDAVQLAPHVPFDVKALDCDLLAFSPYKLFGPHAGVLWCRRSIVEQLQAYKVRPAPMQGALRFETGTPSFEAQAGVIGMIEYLDWLGAVVSPSAKTRRERLVSAFHVCERYEAGLGDVMLRGLLRLNGIRLYGPSGTTGRVPTYAFTVEGHPPAAVAQHLADNGIFAWAGHFYAVETMARLGLENKGGLVRVGLCHYNTREDVNRFLGVLADLLD
jgi:cysteine desulfurase family protein (TIGR01976 family)